MPSAEWYAARRREKLETHQNALPSEERMVNRTDWDEEFGANLCVTTARAREDAKKKFLALAIDPAVSICETPDQALAYFTPNGPPFTVEVMRKFAEAIAISSRPLLVDGVLSARSCAHTLITLWSASKAARNPVHPDVKEATLHYIYGPLVTKGLIHTMAKEKATAIPEDLSAFIKVLFSPRFAITVSSTREVLLLALFVCLQIDCSSRVSELVVPTLNTEDTKAYKAKHPEKAFLWSSVEIYAYPHHGPGGSVTLRARLTFRGIKDVSKKGYRVKRIPLRLLPPSNVAEDSLFWLVTLGLIDGVFNGISSWNDIDQLQPGEKGLMLRVKYPFREYPVLRPTKYHATVGDDLVSKDQMSSHQILNRLHKLSQTCGLKHAMLPNVLRRSSADLLALTVTPEERKARMGHSENSQVYWGAYRNTTSTVDFQALRHDVDKTNVATMSSVFLNTDDPPPSCVSDEGMTDILNDPDLVAISVEQSDLLDELLTQHGSMESAQTQSPARHGRYQTLRKKHAEKLRNLEAQRYKSEYKAWWAAKEGRSEHSEPETPVSGTRVDQLLVESQDQDDQVSKSAVPIDPRLLEEAEAEASAAAASLAKGLDDVDENGNDPADSMETVRKAVGSHEKLSISSKKPRKFVKSDEDVPRYTLIDSLPVLLYERAGHFSWAEISAVCTTVFNHLHSPGRFYPNQEPLPGTWACRFCGLSFLGDELPKGNPPEYHSYVCEGERRKDAEYARINSPIVADQICPLGNCSYKLRNMTDVKFISHVRSEKKHYSNDPEPEFLCSNHDAPLVLDMLEEVHVQAHVNAGDAAATITQHGLCGSTRSMILVHPGFCIFCVHDTHLSVLTRFRVFSRTEPLLQHVADHVMEITDAISCPAVGSTPEGLPQCDEAATFGAAEMGAHLEEKHGIRQVPSARASRQQKKASQQDDLDGVQAEGKRKPAKEIQETSEAIAEEQNLDVGEGKAKKRKTGVRQPLGELDANSASMKL
ncbi:hypothetical protein SLS63_012445 [Diaporthe eres]|uniref:C2H2-type domain-containing protein n=1 Tax=Diaporthe eres TaxID=83184 RepID=A0ABR1NRA0_DIAER